MVSLRIRALAALARITPSVWRVLAHSILLGLAISIAELLFNFYLVSLGYAADVAGLLSMVSRIAGAAMGLPIGMLIERAGPRRSLILGAFMYGASWGVLLLLPTLWALALMQALIGVAYLLALAAVVPMLAAVTQPSQRSAIFGLNASVSLMIGLLGSAVGGVLPGLAATLLNVAPLDTAAYRFALASVVVLSAVAVLPVLRHIPDAEPDANEEAANMAMERVSALTLVRFTLPALFLGVAGGALLPFQNLFLRQQFGLSDAAVGAVLAWSAVGMGVGAVLGAPVSARLGLQRSTTLLRLGAFPATLLILTYALLPTVVGFFLRGMFVAASYPQNDALVMRLIPPQQRGVTISLMGAMWSLGWAATSVVSGWVQIRWGFGPPILTAALAYLLSGAVIAMLPQTARPPDDAAPELLST